MAVVKSAVAGEGRLSGNPLKRKKRGDCSPLLKSILLFSALSEWALLSYLGVYLVVAARQITSRSVND